MFYKTILILLLFFFNSCSPVNNAFFGPTFTAVKTGSVAQTSISYTSSKFINDLKNQVIINNKIDPLNKNHHKS